MKKIFSNLFSIVYIITIIILLVDSYRSRVTIDTYIHVSSRTIEFWSIVFLICLRYFTKQELHFLFKKINAFVILPLTLATGVLLTIIDYLTPTNYVFSLTSVQYTQVFYISIFSLIVWLLSHNNHWFKVNYKKIIFLTSLAYLFVAYIISLFPNDVFAKFSQEDHVVENLQVIILVLGSIWSLKTARILFKTNKRIVACLFAIAAIVLFFIASDEISWGQRIFHITTPSQIASVNDQKEITIHNLKYFSGTVGISYIAIGLYGGLAWVSQYVISELKKYPYTYFISPWFCSIFYLSGFAYNFYVAIHFDPFIGIWAESAELMLYSGISFTMLVALLSSQKLLKKA